MGMSSVKQVVWFGWNVKNFAQNLLIGPGSTRGRRSTLNSGKKVVGGEGGEGRGVIDTQLRKKSCRRGGRGGEGGSIDTQLGKDPR